jgi:hypothetical protein
MAERKTETEREIFVFYSSQYNFTILFHLILNKKTCNVNIIVLPTSVWENRHRRQRPWGVVGEPGFSHESDSMSSVLDTVSQTQCLCK